MHACTVSIYASNWLSLERFRATLERDAIDTRAISVSNTQRPVRGVGENPEAMDRQCGRL